jgi:GNAT superfamily N-acetyltransferase
LSGDGLHVRLAEAGDAADLAALMDRAIGVLMADVLDPAQIAGARETMGLDTQLIADGTYFVVMHGSDIAGCGGWSRRATLHGGNHSAATRDDRLLDPSREPARVRAMYTEPRFARRGVGRLILATAEAAARAKGFTRVVLAATPAGRPLYEACGYGVTECLEKRSSTGSVVPLFIMAKALT